MNRGLIRGFGLQGEMYTPLIAVNAASQPSLGTAPGRTWGRYSVLAAKRGPDICVGWAVFQWGPGGSGGTAASQYAMSLPLPVMSGIDAPAIEFPIGNGKIARVFTTHSTPVTLYTLGSNKTGTDGQAGPLAAAAGLNAPGWCQMVVGHYTAGGSASFAASTTLNIAHGLGATPDAYVVSQRAQTPAILSVTADATNLAVVGSASTSSGVNWMARVTQVFVGSTTPWAWGSDGDLIEICFTYPVG